MWRRRCVTIGNGQDPSTGNRVPIAPCNLMCMVRHKPILANRQPSKTVIMKQFRVFKDSSGHAEAVKLGWSWPAALFSIFWAPFKGLWTIGIGGLVATMALGYVVATGTDASTAASVMNLVLTLLGVLFGFKGNAWRESRLFRRGFVAVGTVTAVDERSALASVQKQTP
jgi:hypothetical protein